ncbi:MAG TPA: hypothetical protein DCM71_05250 [Runella sp.]|nr:hypothetical protein [Runella sp.]
MQNITTSDQQMTDVLNDASGQISTKSSSKLTARQKAAISTATILLGGGAAFAAVNWDKIVNKPEEPTAPLPTPTPSPEEPTAPVKHNHVSVVQNGTIKPNQNIDIAGGINENMTFDEAYAAARAEVGPGGVFSWHGNVYNTFTVEEWQSLSIAQRQEFLSDIGFQSVASHASSTEGVVAPLEPNYVETIINGRPALAIDENHDGIADAIVMMDIDSNSMVAIVNNGGDDGLDTVLQIDATTQEIVRVEPLEEPVITEMSKLERLGDTPQDTTQAEEESTVAMASDDEDVTDDDGYINDAEIPEMD